MPCTHDEAIPATISQIAFAADVVDEFAVIGTRETPIFAFIRGAIQEIQVLYESRTVDSEITYAL
jgi:hypothetical protein